MISDCTRPSPTVLARFVLFGWLLVMGSGCTLSKVLQPDEFLYTGAEVSIEKGTAKYSTTALETSLNAALYPKPNRKLFGIRWRMRTYLLFYNDGKKKGIASTIRDRLGEAPVIYRAETTDNVADLLENRSINMGYFGTEVIAEEQPNGNKMSVNYQVFTQPPYRIRAYANEIANSAIHSIVDSVAEKSKLELNDRYDLDQFKAERARIANVLRERGYYFFEPDFLKFVADSTTGQREIGLRLQIKDDVPAADLNPYFINDITVRPDYSLRIADDEPANVEQYEGLTIYHRAPPQLDNETIRYAIINYEGQRYSNSLYKGTLQRLFSLDFYKYINAEFDRVPESDSLLNMEVLLTPRVRYTFEGSLGGYRKSTQFYGPEFSLGIVDRNLFGGAEKLRFDIFGSFNYYTGEKFLLGNPFYSIVGGRLTLEKPGLLIPFNKRIDKTIVGTTIGRLEFNSSRYRIFIDSLQGTAEALQLQQILAQLSDDPEYAPFVGFNSYEIGLGYRFYRNRWWQHEANPLKIIYRQTRYELDELRTLLFEYADSDEGRGRNVTNLLLQLEPMVLYQMDYIITYDERLHNNSNNTFRWRQRVSLATNRFFTGDDDMIPADAGNSIFSQLETDLRYYWQVAKGNIVASRLLVEYTQPITGVANVPLNLLYNVGGANSVRAFPPRTLGPGTSSFFTGETALRAGIGDIRLEANLEYRFDLTELLEVAAFVDIGNVWFSGEQVESNDAVFDFSEFYRELGGGAGLGLRVDLGFLVVRLDGAVPFLRPYNPEGQRLGFTDATRPDASPLDDLNLSFAFGYPF